MSKIKLSPNFSLSEFAVSSDYPVHASLVTFDNLDEAKARLLVTLVLQPVRDEYGKTTITSGKRSAALNQAVGGAFNSDHLYNGPLSAAVDFTCPKADMETVYKFIRLRGPGMYGQLIYYRKSNFIHVSLPDVNRHVGESWINEK